MARISIMPAMEFYQDNKNLKWIILVISIIISIGSLYYTNILVAQLKSREKKDVELFAKALEYTINEDLNQDISFVSQEIVLKNNAIPTIWITTNGDYQYQNFDIDEKLTPEEKRKILEREVASMKKQYEPIKMTYRHEGKL
jgi:hypothetical protein